MGLEDYSDFLSIFILRFLKSGFYIYVPAQAVVYVFGRMLGIFNGNTLRNLLALISIFVLSYFYIYLNFPSLGNIELLYEVIQWSSMAIIFYVLLGFKLADRMDHFLDKRFADDTEVKKKKKK